MKQLEEIIEEIRKVYVPTPTEVEKILDFAEKVRYRLFNLFKDLLENEEDVFIAGSVARGTFLKGESDIDIFLRFPPKYEIETIKEVLFDRLYKLFPRESIRKRYAEHPYAEVTVDEKTLNIVPCFKTEYPNWKSPADRSFYHHIYLRDKIKDIREDIIIAKAFLRGIGVYGAEVYVGGFSGYLTELLIYHYRGFKSFLKNIVKWRPPLIIDIENHYSSKKDILNIFGLSPLIVVDPIDRGRNVAAAVTRRKFSMAISASKAFLSNPSREFFYKFRRPKKIKINEINNWINILSILVLDLKHKPRIEDIHFPQLQSFAKKIVKQLEIHGFNVLKYMSFSDFKERSMVFILLEKTILPHYTLAIGPYPYHRGEKSFLTKNSENLTWIGLDGRWYSLKERRFTDAMKLVETIVETPIIRIPEELYETLDIYILNPQILESKFIGDQYIKWLDIFLWGDEFWKSL